MEIEVTFSDSDILKHTSKETVYSLYSIFSIPLCSTKKMNYRSTHQRCSVQKGVLKNFAKFTGKQLFQNLFFPSNERKRKDLRKIGECAGQMKISFAKLPRRVCKYQIILNIDPSC